MPSYPICYSYQVDDQLDHPSRLRRKPKTCLMHTQCSTYEYVFRLCFRPFGLVLKYNSFFCHKEWEAKDVENQKSAPYKISVPILGRSRQQQQQQHMLCAKMGASRNWKEALTWFLTKSAINLETKSIINVLHDCLNSILIHIVYLGHDLVSRMTLDSIIVLHIPW